MKMNKIWLPFHFFMCQYKTHYLRAQTHQHTHTHTNALVLKNAYKETHAHTSTQVMGRRRVLNRGNALHHGFEEERVGQSRGEQRHVRSSINNEEALTYCEKEEKGHGRAMTER